jgi:ribonuclease P protein component
MLPKKQKLNRANFGKVLQKSKKIEGENFSFRARFEEKSEKSRYSVVVSAKVSKKAVDRNRLKRQVYEVLANNAPKTGILGVIYAKKDSVELDFKAINKEVSELFNQI